MSDSNAKSCLGCGIGCAILFFGLPIFLGVFTISKEEAKNSIERRKERQVEEARQAEIEKAQKAEAARIAEAERKRQEKADKIQTFALKDAPKVWAVYQSLKSEIDVQNGKIEDLRKTLVSFGRSPEQDEDFKRICALRDEMIRSQTALYAKLEDAYIAAKKYEASPSRKDYQELHKKALEDGILEADAAEAKFKEMRLSK